MAKSSKQKPTTGSSKPLSNAAKAAQRQHVTDYKSSKASAIASSVKGKGARYYDEYDDDDKNDKNDDNDDNKDDGDSDEDSNSQDDGSENGNKNNSKGSGDEDAEDYELPEPKYHPYKSKCGGFIFIPDEQGEYTKYTMLDRPEGKLKNLPKLMKMGGPKNKELVQGIQSCIRTVTLHVARNIPKCKYHMLSDEQRGSIKLQALKKYPILGRYRRGWVTTEFIIRGQVAWCAQLKAKREAKKTAQGNTSTGKGEGKSQPSNTTDQAEESSKASNNLPQDEPDEVEATPAPKSSRSKRPAIRRVQDSEEEAGEGEPKPEPTSQGVKVSKPVPKAIRSATNIDEEAEPTPTSPPISSKRKAQEDASDRPQKIVRNQPIEGSENEINDGNEQGPSRPPAPASDTPPGNEDSTTSVSGNVREVTPSVPAGGKRKTNARGNGKGKGKDKPLPLAESSPTPNPMASGSDAVEETEQPAKQSKRGRQAKQELIDEVDGVVGSSTAAPAKKGKNTTRKRAKRA
ncbi:unnamed protein product [Rhizoctonia solani]|uniref:Uncharacterized protein n=1 Tax=Rhizoctonia solani TaxID=456999 RepID=A0A8H3B9I4_9AGAM|nr:unnamed protein product [Rhizoctonia solani]